MYTNVKLLRRLDFANWRMWAVGKQIGQGVCPSPPAHMVHHHSCNHALWQTHWVHT